mgnify:CR=1 FL=1
MLDAYLQAVKYADQNLQVFEIYLSPPEKDKIKITLDSEAKFEMLVKKSLKTCDI